MQKILGVGSLLLWALFFRQFHLIQFVRSYKRIKSLQLFDSSYYRSRLVDDLPSWVNPLADYLAKRAQTFADPHPIFNTQYYTEQNPVIVAGNINPLTHFVLEGIASNRSPHFLIDINFYTKAYPDVLTEFDESPLQHLLKYGLSENRQTHVLVDCDYYLKNNPDVAELGVNPLVHFLEKGGFEGRDPSTKFDTSYYLREHQDVEAHGVLPFGHFLTKGIYEGRLPFDLYSDWIQKNETQAGANIETQSLASLVLQPLISIIMPVFNTDTKWLKKAINSVRVQDYTHWELCIADDGSTSKLVRPILEEFARLDTRIRVIYRPESGHISAASNSALALASGEFIALMDHDDELAPNALREVALMINQCPDVDLIYSDEDKISPSGRRFDPFFKPGWSPERLFSQMYCNHLGIYRASIVRKIGGFRLGYEGSQDYDLILRFTEKTGKVCHIAKVLYHWRTIEDSTAINPDSKSYAYEAAEKALQDALDRRQTGAYVSPTNRKFSPGHFRVNCPLIGKPKVSIILVDDKGGWTESHIKDSVRSLIDNTTYDNFEIVISTTINRSAEMPQIRTTLSAEEFPEIIVVATKEGQFSKLVNAGISVATGTFIALIDLDLNICTSNWVELMVARAQQPGVGVVGPKLITSENLIHSAGLVLRYDGPPMHSHQGHLSTSINYFGHLGLASNCCALSSEYFVVNRQLFEEAGNFDTNLPPLWAETDFCLRLFTKGYRHIFEPGVVAQFKTPIGSTEDKGIGEESLSIMQERWSKLMISDPFYNPNLSRENGWHTLNNFDVGRYLPHIHR